MPVAVNCWFVPKAIVGAAGETTIEVSCTAAPMPCRVAVCGLVLALSTTVRVPEALPAAVGVKVTLIVQVPPAESDDGHVLAAKGPVVDTLVIVSEVDCEFVRTTDWALLVDPTTWLENCKDVGDRKTL